MPEVVNLRPYQRDGVRHLRKHPKACLFYDPGLGKTLTSLLAFELLRRTGEAEKALVVAPLRVAQSVWQQEAQKWGPTTHLRVELIHGARKATALAAPCDIHVINYEGLLWLTQQFQAGDKWPWGLIIFDELSKLKATNTRRHKELRKVIHQFPRRWGLTGTPAPNSLLELFGQMLIIDSGKALGKNLFHFQQQYFYKRYPASYEWLPKPTAERDIAARLSGTCHRLAAKDHLNLPPRTNVYHAVDIGTRSRDIYIDMEQTLLADLGGEEIITAMSAAALWGKLQQIANGFIYDDQRQPRWLNTAKAEVLEDIIEEAAGQPVLVFYRFKADLELLQSRIKDLVVYSRDVEDAWNRGEIRVMAANPQSAGHGLNLQAGGHIIVWYVMDPSLERYIQGNGRLDRQGQKLPVIVHHLVAAGTIDDETVEVLERRATVQEALLSRVGKFKRAV